MTSQIPETCTNTEMFRDPYREELQKFLQGISFTAQSFSYNLSVEKSVIDYLKLRSFSIKFIQRIYPVITMSALMATSTYPFVPTRVQEVIAIFTALATAIDDDSRDNVDDLKGFQVRLYRGQPQPNQLLQSLVHFMGNVIPGVYGEFATGMMIKAITEYISACVFENEYEGRLVLPKSASSFPYYLREKTGVAEAYTLFAFPEILFPEDKFLQLYAPAIPDIARYINLGNDFLSFYKESVISDERLNYIYNHSRVNGLTPIQSLQSTSSSLIDTVHNIRATLSVEPSLQNAIEQLFHGFVVFHCSSARYRLSELGIAEIEEVNTRVHFPEFDEKQYIGQKSTILGGLPFKFFSCF